MAETKIKITCPVCKKEFAVVKPEKPGAYKVTCPHAQCARVIKLVLRPTELKMGQGNPPQNPADKPAPQTNDNPAADKPTQPDPNIRMVGKPEKTEKGIYLLKTPLTIGEKSAFTCPGCGKQVVLSPTKAGALAVTCPACSTRTAFRAVDPKPLPTKDVPHASTRRLGREEDAIKDQKAELVWGNVFKPHKAVLKEGITWVGRNEPTNPSDVMIDDRFASAHSFYIEKDSQKGTCKLCVEHATNPVTVNGVECKEGNSVYLSFNDKITAGKTILILKKSK